MKTSDWFRGFYQDVNKCADTDCVLVPDDYDEKMAGKVQAILKASEEEDEDVEMLDQNST